MVGPGPETEGKFQFLKIKRILTRQRPTSATTEGGQSEDVSPFIMSRGELETTDRTLVYSGGQYSRLSDETLRNEGLVSTIDSEAAAKQSVYFGQSLTEAAAADLLNQAIARNNKQKK